MNFRDLKYLVAVAEYKHFGRAAKACNVSQPALSMQLQKLEKLLGIKFFERNNKTVVITEVGRNIVSYAKKILQNAQEIEHIAKAYHNPFAGELKLGAFPTLAPYLLPQIVTLFINEYSKMKLFLIEEKTNLLIDKLISGEIEIAFLALPVICDIDLLEYEEIFVDEFLFATSCNNKFAKKQYINIEDLKGETLLLLEDGHCLRDQALDLCFQVGAFENQGFRATSLETLRQMVASGIGSTLIPKIAQKENDNIVYIPFIDNPPSRRIALVWRKTTVRKELFKEMIQKIKFIFN